MALSTARQAGCAGHCRGEWTILCAGGSSRNCAHPKVAAAEVALSLSHIEAAFAFAEAAFFVRAIFIIGVTMMAK